MTTSVAMSRLGAVVRRLRHLRATLGTAGLALALIAGQGGALLHELGHYRTVTVATATSPETASDVESQSSTDDESQPAAPGHGGKVCDLCLAFAQLAGVLHSDPFAVPLIVDLRHRAAAVDIPVVVAIATPAPRSRGPPSLL